MVNLGPLEERIGYDAVEALRDLDRRITLMEGDTARPLIADPDQGAVTGASGITITTDADSLTVSGSYTQSEIEAIRDKLDTTQGELESVRAELASLETLVGAIRDALIRRRVIRGGR